MIPFVYLVIDGVAFVFPRNIILPFCQKTKMIFSRKITHDDDISCIIEKDDVHPKKYCISSDRKIKDDKKAYLNEKKFQ